MKRLNIYGAFTAIAGPGTKEDVIIQVAKQQNIRFNELPQLQKEVDQALEESQRLGFIERQGTNYKLIMEAEQPKTVNKSASNKANNTQTNVERSSRNLTGQGDGKRSHSAVSTRSCPKPTPISLCTTCSGVDAKVPSERRKNSSKLDKFILPTETSLCSICGLSSDNPVNTEDQEVWPISRTTAKDFLN